jgi:uncharacterized protein (TIGR03437 family)
LYMMILNKPATCDLSNPPTSVSTFPATTSQAYLWFYVTNVAVGDVFSSAYYTPSGQPYAGPSGSWAPSASSGSQCLTDAAFYIAGATPATTPGIWSVKVSLNGLPLFTLSFTIQQGSGSGSGSEQVQLSLMTRAKPPTCDITAPPTAATVFYPTDAQAYLWFYVNNVAVGDVFSSEYYTPSGQFYGGPSGAWIASATSGSQCYTDAAFNIAGATPATTPGIWTVKVKLNGNLLFTLTFTISNPNCTYSISGGSLPVSATAGNLTLSVTVASGSNCPSWSASSNVSWITIQSGGSGSGNGTVTLLISTNTSTSSRSGTVTIAGQTVTITQSGATPQQTQVTQYMMTAAVPAACSASNPPTAAPTFQATDPQAYLWFYVTNDAVGDVFSSAYYGPSGQSYSPTSGSWPAVTSAGSHCFADNPFQIAGATPATMPGLWTVKVTLNGQLVFTLTFTILPAQNVPTISAIAGGGGSLPPVKEVSPGGYVMISGSSFATAGTARQVQQGDLVNGMLPTQLAGVCVDVSGQSGYVTFVAPTQVYFQMPNVAVQSSANIRVRTNCGASNEQVSNVKTAWCQTASPEFLYWAQNSDGTGPVAAVNAVTGALVGLPSLVPGIAFSPARPGDVLTIYGVSFGATSPSYSPGQLPSGQGTVTGNPAVRLGSTFLDPSNIVYAGVSPGTAGLYQLSIRVPSLPDGNYPLVFSLGIFTTPSAGYITIRNY